MPTMPRTSTKADQISAKLMKKPVMTDKKQRLDDDKKVRRQMNREVKR